MKQGSSLAAVMASIASVGAASLGGCAQSACSQPDVLAYVDKARQAHDLYAIGLTANQVRETPIVAGRSDAVDPHAAACSAWLLSHNPAYQPGNGQPQYVRTRQDFWVAKLAQGYKVGLYRD